MGEYPKGVEFTESLHTSMVQSVISRKLAPDTLVHSYKSFNGFVARLTKEESERMRGMDEVVSVIPNRIHSIQTTRSWNFIGFPENVQRTKVERGYAINIFPNYFEDIYAIGAFHAMKRGILTSAAAGNFGPDLCRMSNLAPWFISVAASTTDRKFLTNLQLGNGRIFHPDIAAPGVEILAAWSPISPISELKGDRRVSNLNIISGTSMACPHVTAAAAYVKSFHPNWSPAAIKSALMTTATAMNSALNEEAEFAYGAGQINPLKAVNPGLVYDAGESDYISFLCGQGYNSSSLQKITDDNSTCTSANKGSVFNLNLPSFALSTDGSSYNNVTFGRTVTNVGSATSKYRATITAHPSSLNVQVLPNVLAFSSLGQRLSFTLNIKGSINVGLVSFSLIWDDGTFKARSPVVVYVS
ncbi:cucumisin-like [Vigna radiata var. radiata]|uniref:Cucumisin-like n=1 Tax=Vigna radiata var. radiata TaxID=3916 RepID=A0A1S3UAK3_VIGRR|nr:cucumisin-like [Vigna radiata var. radiata]